MNWATIAPETRLYKGKNLYRWEDSPGLEHHCGICATPLHNARAKTTCIGKHVEPCYRFHQQLHFVGKSHECFGCNSSDEMHHNRHKEILKIVRQITTIDQEGSMLPPGRPMLEGKARRESATTISTDTATDTTSESASTEESKKTRRERKRAKKNGNVAAKARRDVEAFPKEETDFISAAIHGTVHESKGAWEGSYVYDHKKPAFETSAVVDEEEEEEEFLHEEVNAITASVHDLAVKSPTELTPRQRKCLKKFSTPINHSSYGGGSRKFSPHNTSQRADPCDGVDPAIFFRLGIGIFNPAKNSKARKDLVVKLVAAVKEDIEIIEREDKESVMREEGFWRWAGKTAFYAITETRTELDWATGQKKGTPRPYEFPDSEIGVDYSEDEDEDELKTPDPQPVVLETPKKEMVIDEGCSPVWEMVVSKKADILKKKPRPTKKFRTLSLKPSTNTFDIVEEGRAGADDVDEMVSRYQQRMAGERTVGRGSLDINADRRTGGSKLTLKVK